MQPHYNDSDKNGSLLPPQLPPPPSPTTFNWSVPPEVTQHLPVVLQNISDIYKLKIELESISKKKILLALLKQEENPVISDKLNRLFPETLKTFQQNSAGFLMKNQIPIPNKEKIITEPKKMLFPRS